MTTLKQPTLATLRAARVIDIPGYVEYPDMPICPMIRVAVGKYVRCDDPFCTIRTCAFRDHPRGRARWLELSDPSLGNWSA